MEAQRELDVVPARLVEGGSIAAVVPVDAFKRTPLDFLVKNRLETRQVPWQTLIQSVELGP